MRTLAVAAFLWLYVSGAAATPLSRTIEKEVNIKTEIICEDPATELTTMKKPFELSEFHREPDLKETIDAATTQKLTQIFKRPIVLSSVMLDQGVANVGDPRRLERALYKLVTGQPVTVVALGGSITYGMGVWRPKNSWVARVFDWIEKDFPHSGHVLLNKAYPATTASYAAPCVLDDVPHNVDLVLFEYTFYDGERTRDRQIDDSTQVRRGMERLIRKLWRIPSRPALLYLHYWPAPRSSYFHETQEDQIEVLMSYYGLSSLSFRNALHTQLVDEPELLDQLWWPEPSDRLHPSCIGTKFMADMAIGFMQNMAAQMYQNFHDASKIPHEEVLIEQIRKPLFDENYADNKEMCLRDAAMKVTAVGGHGWDWVDEGKKPNEHKWGFVTHNVGSQLVLQVPLAGFKFPMQKLLIGVGLLVSYQHMGYGQVSCLQGCFCEPREVNLHHNFHFSLSYFKPFIVEVMPGSQECVMVVNNIAKTRTGEHKLKVTSLLVSEELGMIESYQTLLCPDCA